MTSSTTASSLAAHAGTIRWVALAVIVAALLALARALPLEPAVGALQRWIEGLGMLAPLAFGAVYVAAALLFVPGSLLTIAAGLLFGPWLGTAVVSAASVTAAALAFLIARHLARGAIERKAAGWPKFAAIDRAIGAQGWKIVLLLRLSPLVPFSIGNYLYGLTAIRFVPYVLASWVGMLPGTFLYVYLGFIGRAAVAGGEGADGGSARLVLLVIGLLATAAVTIWVTILAKRALRERTPLGDAVEAPARTSAAEAAARSSGSTASALAWIAAALLAVALAVLAWVQQDAIAAWFGGGGGGDISGGGGR